LSYGHQPAHKLGFKLPHVKFALANRCSRDTPILSGEREERTFG